MERLPNYDRWKLDDGEPPRTSEPRKVTCDHCGGGGWVEYNDGYESRCGICKGTGYEELD